MTSRLTAALGAVALAAALTSATPAGADHAGEKAIEVTSTVVHGYCRGGGQLTLVVNAADDGFDVAATATGLADGELWEGTFAESTLAGPVGQVEFERTTADGGWSAEAHLGPIDDPRFEVIASNGSGSARECRLTSTPSQPLSGESHCRGRVDVGLAASRHRTVTSVRWGFSSARPRSSWDVELTAVSNSGDITIGYQLEAPRDGSVTKHLLVDAQEPRLRLKLTSAAGQVCLLTVDRTLAPPPA